ncbi:uncharacterized protein DDB_G0284459 isoform X4 [Medicago truncatula]|uniref:uncharacterized protein DDB_G0284459 isoform X4 n=1 Tax=Medicago truncatula TaxID=3880 RepID=UPI001968129C|nr:uncharacterized protein DDB_G0284459 isoform X4 [Medicago truncatula]
MIKRRFFKVDHGDRDGSGNSSSSSDEDYDNNQVAQVSDDNDDNDSDGEVSSASSGYKSEDSPANDIDANSAGLLSSEDDAGTINEREMITNKEFPSERNYEKSNVMAEKKPLPSDIPSSLVLQIKSVFKCRLCPRVICLTEDTLRNHLQSKRHARSEKLHEKGRLKAMLNSDGEIEDQEVSDNEAEDAENGKGSKPFKKRFKKNKEATEMQTEDTEDNTMKNEKGPKLHKKRLGKKKNYNANSRKQRRSGKGSSKRSNKE